MPGTPPSISVVIPVFNDSENLRHCLEALRKSTTRDFEVIVIDDGSADDSARIATEAGAVVFRTERQMGPAAARNLGARSAAAPLLFFMDADVCAHADTLDCAVRELSAHPEVAAVIGSYDASPSDDRFISQYKNLFHRFVHQTARREAGTFWTGCGAIRREVFVATGGFDTTFKRPVDRRHRTRRSDGTRGPQDSAVSADASAAPQAMDIGGLGANGPAGSGYSLDTADPEEPADAGRSESEAGPAN